MKSTIAVPLERIEDRILLARGHKVLLDADLAALYGATTKRLNEQVKRNRQRFPDDFVFRLNAAETKTLDRSQIATGSLKHRDPRFTPYAFTEHGTIMAAMVLNSQIATGSLKHRDPRFTPYPTRISPVASRPTNASSPPTTRQ